jgi:hypothetical protein
MVFKPLGADIDPRSIIQSRGADISLYTLQQVSPPELPQAKINLVLGNFFFISLKK